MKKRISVITNVIFAGTLLLPTELIAQTDIGYQLRKYNPSAQTSSYDLENTYTYSVRKTGALVHWMASLNDSAQHSGPITEQQAWSHLLHKDSRNVLQLSLDNVNTTGEYLHTDGRRQTFGNLLAGGQYTLQGIGTIYGMANYRNGSLRDTYLNYAVHPEDIAPYFASDTLGKSNMNQEIYTIAGGFSFPLARMEWGVDVVYEGIAQSRTHDPRLSDYAHHVELAFSGAKVWSRDLLSLRIVPEWSRQSISVSSLREGVRYFEFYGFGLWNRRESQGAIAYGRTHTIHGISLQPSWTHRGQWNWMLSGGYRFRAMEMERYDFKELFGTDTHLFNLQLMTSRQFGSGTFYLQLNARAQSREGKENVYESQMMDEEQGLYDNVKVGTNRLYTHDSKSVDVRAKYLHMLSPSSSIALWGVVAWNDDQEKYESPAMKIQTQVMSGTVGIDYKRRCKASQWEATLYSALQGALDNEYSLFGETTPQRIAMASVPYQLRGENHQVSGLQLIYAHSLRGKYEMGATADASYLNSDIRRQYAMSVGVFLTF